MTEYFQSSVLMTSSSSLLLPNPFPLSSAPLSLLTSSLAPSTSASYRSARLGRRWCVTTLAVLGLRGSPLPSPSPSGLGWLCGRGGRTGAKLNGFLGRAVDGPGTGDATGDGLLGGIAGSGGDVSPTGGGGGIGGGGRGSSGGWRYLMPVALVGNGAEMVPALWRAGGAWSIGGTRNWGGPAPRLGRASNWRGGVAGSEGGLAVARLMLSWVEPMLRWGVEG